MTSRPLDDRRKVATFGVFGTLLCSVAIFLALSSSYRFGVDGPVTNAVDFRAFYCAGRTWRIGGDPYRVEPMRSCESRTLSDAGLRGNGRTLPAPFPPYALAYFAPLSLLDIRIATELWLTASLLALGGSVFILVRLTGLRPAAIALALVGSVGFASLVLGQVVPIVFCAVVFAAWRARAGDGVGVSLGAAIAALEPHLALPLWAGLWIGVPVARRPLAIVAAALAGVSLARSVPLSIEFFLHVLPEHARSELYNFSAQYSATALAAVIGFPAAAAAAAGTATYAIMLTFGTLLGRRLARRWNDPAFAALAPVAAVLLGGQFLHIHQIALALPFALLVFARLPRRSIAAGAMLVAIGLLAIPWEAVAELPFYWDHHPMSHAVEPMPALRPADPRESIEIPYTASIDASAERSDPRSLIEQAVWKMPTWFALSVMLWLALRDSAALPTMRRRS